MSWSERLRRAPRRIELRLGTRVAAATALLLGVVLSAFFLQARREAFEEVEGDLVRELHAVALLRTDRGELPEAAAAASGEGLSVRVTEGSAPPRVFGAPWPTSQHVRGEPAGWLTPFRVRHDDWLVRSVVEPRGRTIDGAVALSHFVREQRELVRIFLWSLLGGCLLGGAVAAWLASRALAPLRAATRAVESIDEASLAGRLPDRGTGDLVDRHARALNRVLGRLEWAFARMRAFSADAAHELRTPLNRILNLADVGTLEESSPDDRLLALERVRHTTLSMSRMVDSLLLLSRGEEGRLPLAASAIDARALLDPLVDLYRPMAEDRDIALRLRAPAVPLRVDPQLVSRCVSNLVDNAIRSTPAGGTIEIRVEERDRSVVLRVDDSGGGIPAGDRERVFERFVQLDPSRSSGAAGLGLPLARMIARLHRGELVIADSPLGGASLRLTLPR
jgi:signal transduction histidine kinase